MTDRELLELAAKAYWGDEIDDVCSVEWSEEDQAIAYTHGENQDYNGLDVTFIWNPITDDGDAFRLANKLSMDILHNWESVTTQWKLGRFCREKCTDETRDEATRRAITRAAAEIGKAMP